MIRWGSVVRSGRPPRIVPLPPAPVTTTPPHKTSPHPASVWRLVVALAAALVLVSLIRWAPVGRSNPQGASQAGEKGFVTLEKQRPEKPAQSAQVAWSPGTTVLVATQLAGESDPAWDATWRGEGAMTLLISLGGDANEGADGLNWQFEVNGVYADRGAGAYELEAGDRVLWKLAPYE